MASSFARRTPQRRASRVGKFESYNFKGLNLVAPDQVMPVGEVPHSLNSRSYAKETTDKRVSARKRKGSAFLSTPVGEIANVSNVATAVGDASFTQDKWLYEPFTPSASGLLTKLEIYIKKATGAVGPVIVEVLTDNSGLPGSVLATSSITASTITTSYQYLPAYYMEAPSLTSGTQYWRRIRVQTGSAGTYYVNTTAGTGLKSSTDSGATLTPLSALSRFKSYTSTALSILGYTRRYPTNSANRTYFAVTGHLYEVTDAGTPTSISTNIHASATKVRFEQVDDKLIWVDGFSTAKWWDGSVEAAVPNVTGNPTHVIAYNNRLWFVEPTNPNRLYFSDLGDYETYQSTSFLYASPPKSADAITGLALFQDNLIVFTHKTKYIVTEQGGGISTVTMNQAIGTKGAISQEAIAVDKDGIWFIGDDYQLYLYNGISDKLMSEKVEPELKAINSRDRVRLHLYRNQVRVYYSKSPETIVSRMLLFDIQTSQWFQDADRYVLGSLEWTLDNGELIEFSSRTGQMFTGESGNSDVGKPIAWELYTPYYNMGSGMSKKRIKSFHPYIRPSDVPYTLLVGNDIDFLDDPQTQELSIDSGGVKWGSGIAWGDGSKWGDGIEFIDTKLVMAGRGKHTQFRFSETGVDTVPELYGIGFLYKESRDK